MVPKNHGSFSSPLNDLQTLHPAPVQRVTINSFGDLLWVDWIMMALLCAVMVSLTVVRSRTHLLWADELFTRSMITPPSVRTTLLGVYKGADGGGVLFYLLARGWYKVFGEGALALRLFSTTGMCLALFLTWACARRYLAVLPVGLAVSLVYLTTPVLLWQNNNARFYGLFLACAALASYLFLKSFTQDLSRVELLALAGAHAGLIGSHILGITYSFALVAGMVLLDVVRRRLRPSLYAAALSGWVVFLIALPAMRASAKVGANHFWTVRPGLGALVMGITQGGRLPFWALLLSLTLAAIVLRTRQSFRRGTPFQGNAPVVLCTSLLGVQFLLFLKSQVGTSIYVDRYLLPVSIVSVFLFAGAFTVLLPVELQEGPKGRSAACLALFALTLLPLSAFAYTHDIYAISYASESYVKNLVARLPPDQPVLATLPEYNLLSTYDPRHRSLFMLDWPYDLAPARAAVDLTGQHLMQNWQRAGLDPGHILDCPQIFRSYPDVTILVDFFRTPWMADQLTGNPGYKVQDLGPVTGWGAPFEIYSVHRIAPGATPCTP